MTFFRGSQSLHGGKHLVLSVEGSPRGARPQEELPGYFQELKVHLPLVSSGQGV